MADAFLDDDAPVVMATPGPTGLAPIPAVSRGAVVGPARKALRIKTASKPQNEYNRGLQPGRAHVGRLC